MGFQQSLLRALRSQDVLVSQTPARPKNQGALAWSYGVLLGISTMTADRADRSRSNVLKSRRPRHDETD